MALPAWFDSGPFIASSTGTLTPTFPAGTLAGHFALLVCTSENQVLSLSTPAGFAELPNSPQGTGTAGTTGSIRMAVYGKILVGSDASPVVADPGDHNTAQIHVYSGCKTSGNPWNITAGGIEAASDTSGLVPGATTTAPNCLIVLLYATSNNATLTTNFSAQSNADLANIFERTDNSNTAGLGSGHGMATGEKATAGAYTTTAVTYSVASLKAMMSIALEPPPVGTAAGIQPFLVRQAVMRSAVR